MLAPVSCGMLRAVPLRCGQQVVVVPRGGPLVRHGEIGQAYSVQYRVSTVPRILEGSRPIFDQPLLATEDPGSSAERSNITMYCPPIPGPAHAYADLL